MASAEELTTLPRIGGSNNNHLVTKYAIHLYVDTGGVRLLDRFLVSDNLSVPCILGTEFIEQNIERIFPRLARSSGKRTCAARRNYLGERRS